MAAKLQRLMEKVEEDTRTQEQLELRLLQGTDQSPLSLQHAGDHRLAGGVRG